MPLRRRGGSVVGRTSGEVPATATSVGEDVFVLADGTLVLGDGPAEEGLVVTGAYAAVAPGDTEPTVWFTDSTHAHRTRRPDGTFTGVVPPTFPGASTSATTALGYGYFKRGNMFYLNGKEIFWGSTGSPVVSQNGTIRFVGTNA